MLPGNYILMPLELKYGRPYLKVLARELRIVIFELQPDDEASTKFLLEKTQGKKFFATNNHQLKILS